MCQDNWALFEKELCWNNGYSMNIMWEWWEVFDYYKYLRELKKANRNPTS